MLNAKDYGIPQNRERVFTISIRKDIDIGFKFPEKQELELKLKDMLEEEVDEKYYLSDKMINYVLAVDDNLNDTKFSNRVDDCKFNKTPSYAITVRDAGGNQRGSLSNFIYKDGSEEIKVKNLKQQLGIAIRNATKGGYAIATNGDSVNLAYPNSKTRRGRVGKKVSQTLQCTDNMGVVVNRTICLNSKAGRNGIDGLQPSRKDRIYDSNGIATTVATSDFYNPSYLVKENIEQLEHEEMLEDDIETLENEISYRNGTKDSNLRIRKLTPKECWRLMGFDDSDFEKAEKVNSNAQLYKQAGNSIVVDVLEKIFRNLLEGD